MIEKIDLTSAESLLSKWGKLAIDFGIKVLIAFVIFFIGRWIINLLVKWLNRMMVHRNVDKGVITFVTSGARITLLILLFVAILSKIGFEAVSFAALLASMGVAIGMALSNDLKNLAGGLVLLVTRPIRVGDIIESQNLLGTVTEIRIFHTVLTTPDNKKIFIPNGLLSSGAITNYSMSDTRRIDRTVSIEYGDDFDRARPVIEALMLSDKRILEDPAPLILLDRLNSSSVDILVRFWVPSEHYWDVTWDFNKRVYAEFNKAGISFPFPTITVKK
ncbi:mechanosensitive ion channel family protein [Porphyromonas sp.]|uniref:mechanosensitive ion channel family protein n=1 Tax=Porphyromonas sp. TaxID=1924944 RepID=UPI0026DD6AC7|nr:mechanosensitive ion channel domain-containing protein [Porphyromonas sp.]MDO4770381.1 mechanosensitive ion channel [Porphyromonas sp.]